MHRYSIAPQGGFVIRHFEIKLAASDLDGTLLTDRKEITPFTRETLALAAEQGIRFVPSTGRSIYSVPQEILMLPGVEYVIVSNGAAIYAAAERKRVYGCPLEPEAVDLAVQLVYGGVDSRGIRGRQNFGAGVASAETVAGERLSEELDPGHSGVAMELCVDGIPYTDACYVRHPEDYGSTGFGIRYVKQTRKPVEDMVSFAREHRENADSICLVTGDPVLREELWKRLAQEVPHTFVTASLDHLIEIGHQDAGKGKTLLRLLDMLGISPQEAAAFGDADNDLEMLKAVKYGIAVANGAEHCRQAAWGVTESNNEDGVARALRWMMGLEESANGKGGGEHGIHNQK